MAADVTEKGLLESTVAVAETLSEVKTVEYVVLELAASSMPDDPTTWLERGRVAVPARTKRATVVRRAVEALGLAPAVDHVLTLRVVPAEHAGLVEVVARQREPELVIGGE